jgi:hypothetical protein
MPLEYWISIAWDRASQIGDPYLRMVENAQL